jgi:hypothetical protein
VVADRQLRPRQLDRGDELARAEQRHCQDDHAAGLEDAEPDRHQPWVVRGTHQHPVARLQAERPGKQGRHPVGVVAKVPVRPLGRCRQQGAPVWSVAFDGVVDQPLGAVEPIRILELWQVERELWPLIFGREPIPCERVGVRGSRQRHGSPRRESDIRQSVTRMTAVKGPQ